MADASFQLDEEAISTSCAQIKVQLETLEKASQNVKTILETANDVMHHNNPAVAYAHHAMEVELKSLRGVITLNEDIVQQMNRYQADIKEVMDSAEQFRVD